MENRQYIYQKFEDTTEVIRIVTDSNYPCGLFNLLVNVLSVLHSVSDSNDHCGYLQTFGKCVDTTEVIRICN
jgi:hypothetical protein